jgi:hypothetical protein
VFPEGGTTGGGPHGPLRFNAFPFSLGVAVAPVAVGVRVPMGWCLDHLGIGRVEKTVFLIGKTAFLIRKRYF